MKICSVLWMILCFAVLQGNSSTEKDDSTLEKVNDIWSQGYPSEHDVKLYDQDHSSKGKFGLKTSKEMRVQCNPDMIISYVTVKDKWKDGTNGKAELISGGVGQQHVTLKLTSKRFRGFGFQVTVWQQPKRKAIK